MLVGRKVADIDGIQRPQAFFQGIADNAVSQRAGEHIREKGQDIDFHGRANLAPIMALIHEIMHETTKQNWIYNLIRRSNTGVMKQTFALILIVLSLTACKQQVPTVVTEKWLGKWNGPEGTFLNVEQEQGGYSVIIQNLDGPTSFHGQAVTEGISFDRDGATEVIHTGNGQQTGMKWLADKTNCLIVKAGEGFCRD